jgi:hypothetical protein
MKIKESFLLNLLGKLVKPFFGFLYRPSELAVKKSGLKTNPLKTKSQRVKTKNPKPSVRAKGRISSESRVFNHPRKDTHA